MIDRPELLAALADLPDRIDCDAHADREAAAFCGACGETLCLECIRILPSGPRCGKCAASEADRPPAARRLGRWLLSPAGGAIAAIGVSFLLFAMFRDPGERRVYASLAGGGESARWHRAMGILAKAFRQREAARILSGHGHPAEAATLRARAADDYERFIRAYPDDEPSVRRTFAIPLARIAAAECRGGPEGRAVLEEIESASKGEVVGGLASLALARHFPEDAGIARMEAVVERVGPWTRNRRPHSGAQHAMSQRRLIREWTGTDIDLADMEAEGHFRLAQAHAKKGAPEEALRHLERIGPATAWTTQAQALSRELRVRAATVNVEPIRVERPKD